MATDFDIAIIGGGLNGSLTALACASIGLKSVILDAHDLPELKNSEFDGRAYSLSYSSVNMLRALGLWDGVANVAEPILDIKVSDGIAGQGASPFHVHFDHRELEDAFHGLDLRLWECVRLVSPCKQALGEVDPLVRLGELAAKFIHFEAKPVQLLPQPRVRPGS